MKHLSPFISFIALFFWLTQSPAVKAVSEHLNLNEPPLWKIAIVFLETSEDPDLQQSIQENLREIQSIPKNKETIPLQFKIIHGKYLTNQANFDLAQKIKSEVKIFFQEESRLPLNKKPKTLLMFYGHGRAFQGIGPFSIPQLKDLLIPVDLLWMDSCFMSNVEVAYELRHFYRYYLASEDAEISSGIPYKSLSQLGRISSVEHASFYLAEAFMLSYSKSKKGSQSEKILESATTISVIDTLTWPLFIKYFSPAWIQLKAHSSQNPQSFQKSLRLATMDDLHFIDLGSVARLWNLTDLAELMDVKEVKRARLNHDYDYVFLQSTQSDNPVKFIGYTLKLKGLSKNYTGLSIANPLYGQNFETFNFDIYKKIYH